MRRALYRLLLAGSCLGLGACASPPTHYHTLAEAVPAGAAGPTVPFLVELLPVDLPPAIDRQSLVVREGDASLRIVDVERWSVPYSDEFQGALSAALSHQLGTRDVGGFGAAGRSPVLRVKVQVRRLEAYFGQKVDLEAEWTLRFVDAATVARCSASFELAANGGYRQLVAAQRQAVALLAGLIAADARHFAETPQPACPGAAKPLSGRAGD
ncbi:MAG: membrane integrity-associated transporter subunit PqiC [Rhodocyclales bacterium GT-UBC]|nr:MAG: membrane integrity-associated transporter subunit PqiC [Rhodocyclales bacterium GT-UBC]